MLETRTRFKEDCDLERWIEAGPIRLGMLETRTRFKEDCDSKYLDGEVKIYHMPLETRTRFKEDCDHAIPWAPTRAGACWKPGLASNRIATYKVRPPPMGEFPNVGNQDSLQRGLRPSG